MKSDHMQLPSLLLASSSPYRRALLEKLGLAFEHASPNIDESAKADEAPRDLVVRLACAKAHKLAETATQQLIIGSDQLAIGPDGMPLGKPHTAERAVEQLQSMSGRSVTFVTGLCLLERQSGREHSLCEPYTVHFRELSRATIERYVAIEKPLNCAGSFKSEGLGITLFKALEGRDPNSLIGLPLIGLVDLLAKEGITLP